MGIRRRWVEGKKTLPVFGTGEGPCFPVFFVALVVIIRFDLGHPSDIVQLWIGLTLVTHAHFLSFLLQLLTPACQERCGSRVCPMRKNHNLYFIYYSNWYGKHKRGEKFSLIEREQRTRPQMISTEAHQCQLPKLVAVC